MLNLFIIYLYTYFVYNVHSYGIQSNKAPLPPVPSESNSISQSDYGHSAAAAPLSVPQQETNSNVYYEQSGGSQYVIGSQSKSPCSSLLCQNIQPAADNKDIGGNEISGTQYDSSVSYGSTQGNLGCNTYNCQYNGNGKIPCLNDDHVCAPDYYCKNGYISKNKLSLLSSHNKYCQTPKEVCCKISNQCQGSDCYGGNIQPAAQPSFLQPNLLNPAYSQNAITAAPVSKYTGPLNTTPYPGCAAALKCVPENYCTVDGVMSNTPVVLTKELVEHRVALSECLDTSTGIVGKCCRDPNYKDPWPADLPHYHDHGNDDGHIHSHQEKENSEQNNFGTSAPSSTFTIKKPIGVFKGNAGPQTVRVIPLKSFVTDSPPKPFKPENNGLSNSPSYQPQFVQPSIKDIYYNSPTTQNAYAPSPNEIGSQLSPSNVYNPPSSVPTSNSNAYGNSAPQPSSIYVPPIQPQPIPTAKPHVQVQESEITYTSSSQSVFPSQGYFAQVPSSQPLQPPYSSAESLRSQSKVDSSFIQENYAQCGLQTDNNEYGASPWYATVYSKKNRDSVCGAVIISENAILTTANCFENINAESVEVLIGPYSKKYQAAVIVRHPQYNSATKVKDLAIVILKQPIQFDQYVGKICLPSTDKLENYNAECYVSTVSKYNNQDKPEKIKVQLFPFKECEIRLKNTYLGKNFILSDSFSCVSASTEGELCKVRTGDPLICNQGDGSYYINGVQSWTLGCKDYSKVAIFSNNDINWIQYVISTSLPKLINEEQNYQKSAFKGETLEGVNIQEKPGFALGYGK